jgi:hypothetical protein
MLQALRYPVSAYPTVDESRDRLHRAGWSIGELAMATCWVVTGNNGENQIKAEGPRRGGVRRVMRTTVEAAYVFLDAFPVLQWVIRLYSLFGILPKTERPHELGRPVHLGGPGQLLQGLMA